MCSAPTKETKHQTQDKTELTLAQSAVHQLRRPSTKHKTKQNQHKPTCSAPTKETKHRRTKKPKQMKLQTQSKPTSSNRGYHAIRTPLSMKVALATRGPEPLEKQWKVELYTRPNFEDSRSSARGKITETIIISGLPDNKLTDIQHVGKDTRSISQFIRTEAKENMTR